MAAAGAPAAPQTSAVSGIVGTWRMRVSLAPGAPRPGDIELLLVFIPGGVFLGLGSPVERASARIAGPDPLDYQGLEAGQWLQLPSGDVRARSVKLNYNARAQVTHEEQTSYTLTFNGATDTIEGTADWQELGVDGRVLITMSASVSGTRVAVEG
jgi:hypothetical protein